ncbi:MAG: DUF5658 family protein [Candidatus Thermoplasmatota archaeon]
MDYLTRLWSLKFSILLLAVLQVFDTLSTLLALAQPGTVEANPVMRWALAGGGAGLVVAKLAALVLVFVAVALDPMEKPYLRSALVAMNILYSFVLSMNFLAYGLASGAWMLPVAFWGLVLALATVAVDETFFKPHRKATPV